MFGHDIIVIGASSGGVDALPKLIASLPADLPASVFIVLHIPAQGEMPMAWSGRSGPPSGPSMNGPACCGGSESGSSNPSPSGKTGMAR